LEKEKKYQRKKNSPPASAPLVAEIANAQAVQQSKTGADVLEECISGRLFSYNRVIPSFYFAKIFIKLKKSVS